MKKQIRFIILSIFIVSITFNSCKKDEDAPATTLFFSVEDDIQFGQDFKAEIESNPDEYPLLDPYVYSDAYDHLYRMRDSILSSGLVDYVDKFAYEVYIIHDDETLNAFAVPGGYLYFYTGLIKFLDNEAQFVGVLGHEIDHVSKRHTIKQLEKAYGIELLISIVLGEDPGALSQIAADLASGLSSLAFSRKHEYQADEFAVCYMYPTAYDARGIAGFFEKMEGETETETPEFLSTHPSNENRYDEIIAIWESLGEKEGSLFVENYENFKSTLP